MPDNTLTTRLDSLARKLETLAGIDPGAIAFDVSLEARIQRITDAVQGGAFEAHALDAHNDVVVPSPTLDDFLKFDGTNWANVPLTLSLLPPVSFTDLSDVTITTPVAAQFPRYDGSGWVNTALILADLPAITFDDLSDVIITTPAAAQFPRYNGSNWINTALVFADLPAISFGNLSNLNATVDSSTTTQRRLIDTGLGIWTAELDNLNAINNVTLTTPTTGHVLYFDPSGAGIWKNKIGLFADGSEQLTANWDAGSFEITADKWIAQDTTQGSYDTADFGLSVTTTGNDIGTTYRGLVVDQDYTLDTGHIGTAIFRGIAVEQNLGGAGTFVGINFSGYTGLLGYDGQTPEVLNGGMNGINISAKSNGTNTIWASFTSSENAGSGLSYGYQGSGSNTDGSATGLKSIGVYGFAQATNAIMVGVQAAPFSSTTSGFSFYGLAHNYYTGGVTYFFTNTAIQVAPSTTHITPGTDNGSVYIEDKLEVDGIAHFDGDIDHNGTNVGLFGATPVNQAAGMTAQLTTITHTAPGTPDYAVQDLTTTTPFGFVTKDEGNTVLSVIANLQVRVAELEAALDATTGVGILV